jgi:hypothetical protein
MFEQKLFSTVQYITITNALYISHIVHAQKLKQNIFLTDIKQCRKQVGK